MERRKDDNQIISFLMDIKEDVGCLKGEMEKVNAQFEKLNGRVAIHSEHINSVKQDMTGIKTTIAIYSTLAGAFITGIWAILKNSIGIK